MNTSSSIPQEVLEEAADWLLIMQDRPLNADEDSAFRQWLAASVENTNAWVRAEKLMGKLGKLPPSLAMATLNQPESTARRAALTKIAILIAAVPTSWGAWKVAPWQEVFADYSTRVGEQQKFQTADGSRIILNTDSAIDVLFDSDIRLILLRAGEVHIETSDTPDKRPFLVETQQGRLLPLGTRFTVRQHLQTTHLTVLENAVEITPLNSEVVVIEAGQQVTFSADAVGAITTADVLDAAWTTGMIMADATPLENFVEELSRYQTGRFRVDPAIASLPISGSYPVTDIDKALNMLTTTYPITAQQTLFSYLTTLTKK